MAVRIRPRAVVAIAATILVGLGLLTGCGDDARPITGSATPQANQVTMTDGWVKAKDLDATPAFGTLANSGDAPVTVVSATSDVSPMELHEVVTKNGTKGMRAKPGGFVIPPHGTHALDTDGNHLMLMNIAHPLKAGDTVTITLTFIDGSAASFTAVTR